MRFWLTLMALISLVVVGSRAFATTPPQQHEIAKAATHVQRAKAKAVSKPARTLRVHRLRSTASATDLIAVRGEGAIYLVDPSSGAARKVPGTIEMSAPSWSPNLKLLAVEKVEKGGGASVYTIRPDGTDRQLVLENASAPSWSAEGDRIVVVRGECSAPCDPEDDDANVLFSVRVDGSDVQRVDLEESDAYASRELAWPTDGSSIHFFADGSRSGPGSFDSSAAAWSPDGAWLAFTGALGPTEDESASNGLWLVSADGGAPRLLLTGASGRPSWGVTSTAAESARR